MTQLVGPLVRVQSIFQANYLSEAEVLRLAFLGVAAIVAYILVYALAFKPLLDARMKRRLDEQRRKGIVEEQKRRAEELRIIRERRRVAEEQRIAEEQRRQAEEQRIAQELASLSAKDLTLLSYEDKARLKQLYLRPLPGEKRRWADEATRVREEIAQLYARFDTLTETEEKTLIRLVQQQVVLSYVIAEPGREPTFTPSGSMVFAEKPGVTIELEFSTKKWIRPVGLTAKEKKYKWQRYLHSIQHHPLPLADQLFKDCMAISSVIVNVFSEFTDEYGHGYQGCIFSAKMDRATFEKFEWRNLPAEQVLARFPVRFKPRPRFTLGEVQPFKITAEEGEEGELPAKALKAADFLEMAPFEFERFVGKLLEKMGYEVLVTTPTADGGVDLVVDKEDPLLAGKVLVQCKRWSKPIGVRVVRELFGVATAEAAIKSVIIGTSSFTNDAITFAQGKPIELIDGNKLRDLTTRYLRTGEQSDVET